MAVRGNLFLIAWFCTAGLSDTLYKKKKEKIIENCSVPYLFWLSIKVQILSMYMYIHIHVHVQYVNVLKTGLQNAQPYCNYNNCNNIIILLIL